MSHRVLSSLFSMIRQLVLAVEDRRIAGHLRAVERLLRSRTAAIPPSEHTARSEMLDRLARYRQQGVFPRNNTGSFLSPVFVDATGRACAVGHVIGHDTDLVDQLSTSHNLARVGDMKDVGLENWQPHSGLQSDELALIQPQYVNTSLVLTEALPGLLTLVVGIAGAWISHAVRRLRFRFWDAAPNAGVVLFAFVVALAGGWLVRNSFQAWALSSEANPLMWGTRDVWYDISVWTLMALGILGVIFAVAILFKRVVASRARIHPKEGAAFGAQPQQAASQVVRACLVVTVLLGWTLGTTTLTHRMSSCSDGSTVPSEWLPIPHSQCVLDGQVVSTSYVETLWLIVAFAPLVWVVSRSLFRFGSRTRISLTQLHRSTDPNQ